MIVQGTPNGFGASARQDRLRGGFLSQKRDGGQVGARRGLAGFFTLAINA